MVRKRAKAQIDCIEEINHTKVKLHDPGTGISASLINGTNANVRRIRMDGCLAPPDERAADFVVSFPKAVDVIVELKGGDVDHACTQVESTRVFWRSHNEYEQGQVIGAWIVCTEYPRSSLKVQRYRERFRALGCILLISAHNRAKHAFSEFIPKHK
jgi:hypothetical protein